MLFTNHRNIVKKAFLIPAENPLTWTSKYGSISFSQCGKEFPSGGINEEGLVVEQMTLPETIFPDPEEKKGIKEIQLIQFWLDTCKTSQEAIEALHKVQLIQNNCLIHYLICDATGDYRIIEFLQGRQFIFGLEGDRVPVLTNSSYLDSIDYLKGNKKASEIEDPYIFSSIERFIKSCLLISKVNEYQSSPASTAFDILTQVSTKNTTWSFVYDISNLSLYIKDFINKSRIQINLSDLDFSFGANWKVMDISSKKEILSDSTFIDYSFNINKELVESCFHNKKVSTMVGYTVPEEICMLFALYPENTFQ